MKRKHIGGLWVKAVPEDAYAVYMSDKTEVFGVVPAPGHKWLMEIKGPAAAGA